MNGLNVTRTNRQTRANRNMDYRVSHTIRVINWGHPWNSTPAATKEIIFGLYHGDKEIEKHVKDFLNQYQRYDRRKWQRWTAVTSRKLYDISDPQERFHVTVDNPQGKSVWCGQMYLRRRK